jgi:hypothetical protein
LWHIANLLGYKVQRLTITYVQLECVNAI